MSQAGSLLFGGSGTQIGSVVVTDSGSARANASGVLNAVGGSNMNTSGAGNTVTINLDDVITIDSADIGNVDIATNTITTGDVNGNLIFSPDGSGKVNAFYLNNNAVVYFDSDSDMQSAALTNGQLLVGATGSSPAAANITAGENITVTNAAGSITIARSDTGPGGAVKWAFLDWRVLGAPYTQVMGANCGYIVDWCQAVQYSQNCWIEFKFPTQSNRAVGDVYIVNVFRGAPFQGTPGYGFNGSGFSIAITTRNGEAIQAPLQADKFVTQPVLCKGAKDPTSSSGSRLENSNITFVCTKAESNGSGDPATFQVIDAQNNWIYTT